MANNPGVVVGGVVGAVLVGYGIYTFFKPKSIQEDVGLTALTTNPLAPTVPVGGSVQVEAVAFFSDGGSLSVTNQAVWTSLTPGVFSISPTGLVSGAAPGVGTLRVTFDVLTVDAQVTVTAVSGPTLSSISLVNSQGSPVSALALTMGQGAQVFARGNFSDGSQQDITAQAQWTTSAPTVVSVAGGQINAVAAGSAVVRAVFQGLTSPALTVSVTAVVPVLTDVSLRDGAGNLVSSLALEVGQSAQAFARASFSDGSFQDVTSQAQWSSSVSSVASVAGGLVNGVAQGSAVVTATFQGFTSGGLAVNVTQVAAVVQLPLVSDFTDLGLVLPPGAPGSWDVRLEGAISPCSMVKKNGVYYLYYIGADGNRTAPHTDAGPRHRALGVALSNNGVDFTKFPNPVITHLVTPGNEQEEGIFSAAAMIDPVTGNILVYYGALVATSATSLNVNIHIGLAESSDGVNFVDHGPVYQAPSREYSPVGAFENNGTWHVYFIDNEGPWSLRLVSGPAQDLLTTEVLVLSGGANIVGGGDPAFLTADTLAVFLVRNFSTWIVEARTASVAQPGVLSAAQQVYDYPSDQHTLVYLDRDIGAWFLYYANPAANYGIGVRTAPVFLG